MSKDNCTCKFYVVGSESVCILNTEWTEADITLLLLHDNQAWRGEFQITEDDDFTELLDQLSLSVEKYKEETRKALTTHGGAETFAYSLENGKFTWKKYVSTKMAVKFGYVTLSKVPAFEVFEKIVDNTLQSNIDVTEKLFNVKNENEKLEKENVLLKTKLDDLIEKKNEIERTLYSQFLNILNEKKKKIVELKNKLEPLEHESKPENLQSDPFGSETEIDSDEEKEPLPSKIKLIKEEESLEPDAEHKSIIKLPKTSRKGGISGSKAGPSGLGTRNRTKPKLQDAKDSAVLKRSGGKLKESCVIGEIAVDKEMKNTEEDAFAFAKRSKRTVKNVYLTKPSTSKINYESDGDTNVEKTQKGDSDSDRTLSLIDVFEDVVNKIKIEKVEENDIDTVCENKDKNVSSTIKNNSNGETSYKGFSSSTLSILNQLI